MGAMIAQHVTNAIRPPAVAGQFYPANAVRWRRVITAYLQAAQMPPLVLCARCLRLISPCARVAS